MLFYVFCVVIPVAGKYIDRLTTLLWRTLYSFTLVLAFLLL
jgi:hypothetical protein